MSKVNVTLPLLTFNGPVRAAKFLRVSVRHFRRLAEDSKAKSVQIGRCFFWLVRDLEVIREYRSTLRKSADVR